MIGIRFCPTAAQKANTIWALLFHLAISYPRTSSTYFHCTLFNRRPISTSPHDSILTNLVFFCVCRGIINVHASLLPRWRGASPIIHAILNGDRLTGVSIMKIHPDKFDVGEILAQREVQIPEAVLMPELHDTLANVGAELLVECIEHAPAIFQNARQQDDTNVTYGMLSFPIVQLYQIHLC